ncbi:hypothetical protein DH86_00001252, partial [Scytalidium sp. 3C]
TEAELDKILETQAAQLGISVFDIRTALDKLWESSMCETSTTEVESSEDRIDSSDSQRAPNLTGAAWSNPTNNHTEDLTLTDARRPGTSRRLSFSEYDRYLSMAEEQAIIEAGYTPALKERTLSLLSVSSRKSSLGILVGIKKHFRHRRTKTVGDKLTKALPYIPWLVFTITVPDVFECSSPKPRQTNAACHLVVATRLYLGRSLKLFLQEKNKGHL